MKLVDTDVWMYAVGRPHPLRDEARQLLRQAAVAGHRPFTSAEVLKELLRRLSHPAGILRLTDHTGPPT